MLDALSGSSNQSSIDRYVELAMQQASRPKNDLITRRAELNSKKSVLSKLDSKLSALNTIAEKFNDPITDYFSSKSAESSDTDKFTVSSGDNASAGNHSISVERLAKSDTRVSQQMTSSDTSFGAFTTDQTFSIEIGNPTEDDELNRTTLDITINAETFAKSNDDALADIAERINDAMYRAVSDESIANDERIHASVVTESSGNSRLVLRSANSGYKYRMDFTDSTDGLLSFLEVNNTVQSSGTSGGYITEVGTDSTNSMLNSKFTIDGLDFYRDSNSVSDAIKGLTLGLKDTFSTNETITVNSDEESVKEEVESFITAYNESLDFLKTNTQMDPDTYKEGALSNDLTYRNIYSSLRNIISSKVDTATNSDYSRLFHIGIEIDDAGKLSIGDDEKFSQALAANPDNIADIFRSDNGLANQIHNYLDNYIKTGGTIDASKKNIDSNIVSINDRISFMNDSLAAKEQQLRDEFSQMQSMMNQLNSQRDFLNSFSMF